MYNIAKSCNATSGYKSNKLLECKKWMLIGELVSDMLVVNILPIPNS